MGQSCSWLHWINYVLVYRVYSVSNCSHMNSFFHVCWINECNWKYMKVNLHLIIHFLYSYFFKTYSFPTFNHYSYWQPLIYLSHLLLILGTYFQQYQMSCSIQIMIIALEGILAWLTPYLLILLHSMCIICTLYCTQFDALLTHPLFNLVTSNRRRTRSSPHHNNKPWWPGWWNDDIHMETGNSMKGGDLKVTLTYTKK